MKKIMLILVAVLGIATSCSDVIVEQPTMKEKLLSYVVSPATRANSSDALVNTTWISNDHIIVECGETEGDYTVTAVYKVVWFDSPTTYKVFYAYEDERDYLYRVSETYDGTYSYNYNTEEIECSPVSFPSFIDMRSKVNNTSFSITQLELEKVMSIQGDLCYIALNSDDLEFKFNDRNSTYKFDTEYVLVDVSVTVSPWDDGYGNGDGGIDVEL